MFLPLPPSCTGSPLRVQPWILPLPPQDPHPQPLALAEIPSVELADRHSEEMGNWEACLQGGAPDGSRGGRPGVWSVCAHRALED